MNRQEKYARNQALAARAARRGMSEAEVVQLLKETGHEFTEEEQFAMLGEHLVIAMTLFDSGREFVKALAEDARHYRLHGRGSSGAAASFRFLVAFLNEDRRASDNVVEN